MKLKNKNSKGFTLIELLVVISIIGLLAVLLVANFMATRSRARDTQRKSDMRNLATALRLYYNDFGQYPAGSGGVIMGCEADGDAACEWGASFATDNQVYMAYLPDAPLSDDADFQYNYVFIDDDNFLLTAQLENPSDSAIATSHIKCPGAGGDGEPAYICLNHGDSCVSTQNCTWNCYVPFGDAGVQAGCSNDCTAGTAGIGSTGASGESIYAVCP